MAIKKIERNNAGGSGGVSSTEIKTATLNIASPMLIYRVTIPDAASTTSKKIIISQCSRDSTFENSGEEPIHIHAIPLTGAIDITINSMFPNNLIKGEFKLNYIII